MKTIFWPLLILVVLSVGLLVYVEYSSAQLPERFATHFGANGTPDGWMGKDENVSFVAVMGIGIPWLIVGLGLLTRFLPNYLFNLPNKDYWLSPERKTQTCLYVCRYIIWMMCITVLLFAGGQYSIVKANQSSPVKMSMSLFGVILFGYLAAMLLLTLPIYQHFSKKPIEENNNIQI